MRNYALKTKSSGKLVRVHAGMLYWPNRSEARKFAANTTEGRDAYTIVRGPDHPYVKASPDKGMHPKKSKAKTRAFI